MGNLLLSCRFDFLHRIVEEEVNEYGVDVCFWIHFDDLLSDHLHAPDTAT